MRTGLRVAVVGGCLSGLFASTPFGARADEGLWTFNHFPSAKVQETYGFEPTAQWLDHLRMASLRLPRGCSAAFVSPTGLVQTNHHCTRDCLQQLSSPTNNLVQDGFYAAKPEDEVKCPDVEANQLMGITDVTPQVREAVAGREGQDYGRALREVLAKLQRDCADGDEAIRCDVVELYRGSVYDVYKYRRYQDVRLVFSPEEDIAFFGGDPDNFEFPRYDLDVAFLRVYDEHGAPLNTQANYFAYAPRDAQEGDLVFTSGNPGTTERLDTVAELEYDRDVVLPECLVYLAELRGLLLQFSAEGAEHARVAFAKLFAVENAYKARLGQFRALVNPGLIDSRRRAENELRAKVAADPQFQQRFGDPWAAIAQAVSHYRAVADRMEVVEEGRGPQSDLFAYARLLVRAAEQRQLPDIKRFQEFTEAGFPFTRQRLLANAPISNDLEKLLLRAWLVQLRRVLGPDDPLVRDVLGAQTAEKMASDLVDGTHLADPNERKRLLMGGIDAIKNSHDPLIRFAQEVDKQALAVRRDVEVNVEAVERRNAGVIAQVIFAAKGTGAYPDATFSPRVSYGTVKGYDENGRHVRYYTTMGEAYGRATGAEPLALPRSWLRARSDVDFSRKLNIVSTNDIVRGNSGSPVVNTDGQVVGMIFDGNSQSLGGDFGFDDNSNRAVWVSVGAVKEALTKIYGTTRLNRELGI
ncbi:Dipeptidyl-peptidase 7 [Nitrospirillum viridazoti Y2]|uniref:Dipeptidyl-peptidase n=1 Tax=Nitrospirillum amazonense TaxID=28077 RepID=A0A560IZ81_9PROT|nr:Dipeptidyl-peptidase 7 [Nitrospirillum amazonense Y2]TWB64137.1 peptidase S46-like protein [Nitrospirillum amazonense]